MFERFTRTAREVVKAAVVEAQNRGDTYLGSEHILIGVALVPSAAVRRTAGDGFSAGDLRAGLDALDQAALRAVGIDLDETAADSTPWWPGKRRRYLLFTCGADCSRVARDTCCRLR